MGLAATERPLVLITDSDMGEPAYERAVLAAAGYRLETAKCASAHEVVAAVHRSGASGLLTQFAPITRQVLEECPGVRVVGRYGVGLDTVDLEAAAERGVKVVNVPDYGTAVVADHALALLLALARELPRWTAQLAVGRWRPLDGAPPAELAGGTLGLVGFGGIARAVACRARAFGMTVIAHDPFVDGAEMGPAGVEPARWEELWTRSDAVSLHAPLTDETRGAVDAEALERLGEGLLVNTARAGLIDRAALEGALVHGRLRGVALDVWWEEPPALSDPLFRNPRVLVTPHVGWFSQGSMERLRTGAARRVAAALDDALARPTTGEHV